jgi:HSP20 family molecular chaperone IbpA
MSQAIQTQGPVRVYQPRVDVYENAEELLLLADVPGASAESVNIRYEDELLTLQAQRTAANGPNLRYERAFHLPESVDPEQISAELKQGVLHLHLRKAERAKPRTIQIQSS